MVLVLDSVCPSSELISLIHTTLNMVKTEEAVKNSCVPSRWNMKKLSISRRI